MPKRVFETEWFAIDEIPSQPGWNIGSSPFFLISAPDNVLVVPITDDGHLVMVQQFRPALDRLTLEFPAGNIEPGELPIAAAQRELLEETGYKTTEFVSLSQLSLASPRETSICHIFAASNLEQTAKPETGLQAVLLTPQEFRQRVQDGALEILANAGALFLAETILGEHFPGA